MADALFLAPDVAAVTRIAASELSAAFGAAFVVMTREEGVYHHTADAKQRDERAFERLVANIHAPDETIDGRPMRLIADAVDAELGVKSLVVAPFQFSESATGTIILGLSDRDILSEDERELLTAAVSLISHAHQHARMEERKRAAQQALTYIERASRLLGHGTDHAQLLHELAKMALPRLGDYAIIDIVGADGNAVHMGLAHVNAHMEEVLRAYRRRYPMSLANRRSPLRRAITTKEPIVVNSVSRGVLADLAASPTQLQELEQINPTAFIVVPLLRFGEVLGTMSFSFTNPERRFSAPDVALATALGDRVSSVLHSMSLVETSDHARAAAEEATAQLQVHVDALAASNDMLQDQAMELEQQTEEAQTLAEELEATLDQLQHSEVRFRALVDASAQAVWRSDVHGIVTEASESWERLTGSQMHPTGTAARTSSVHPDDRERTTAAWQHAIATKTPLEIEHRIRLKDGSYRWFLGRAVPLHDETGLEVREWVGMHTDIHDQHVTAAEQRFLLDVGATLQRESDPDRMVQRVLAQLVDHLGGFHARLIEIDADARTATIHDAHVAYSAEQPPIERAPQVRTHRLADVTTDAESQLRGEPFVLVDARTDPRTAASYESIFEPHRTRAVMSMPLMRGGKWIASLTIASDVPRAWAANEISLLRRVGDSLWPAFEAARAFVDLNRARREAEQRAIESEALSAELAKTNAELASSESRLAGVVGSAMDAIISVDSDGRINLFSAAAERIFGVRMYDAIGEPLSRFVQPAGPAIDDRGVLASQPGYVRSPEHVVGRRADGAAFPAEATISQVGGDAGHFTTVVLRDVTERRALEVQLVQSQKMEAVGRLAGGVAHDFNNILTVIRSCADFLRESLPETDDRRVDVDEVLEATDRATALTRQLLTFSRKQVVLARVLDLNMIVRGIEPMLRRLIGEDIELAVMLQGKRLAVRADPGQLEQIVINLAVNARDAMSKGGVLGIETDIITISEHDVRRMAFDPATAMQVTRAGEYAVVRVTDTGAGIDPEVMKHVFEPFFTTKAEGHGTGLGLATVHGIATQAGGLVRVRSVAHEGATFEVLLPLLRNEDSGEHLPVIPFEHTRASGRILLVEDEVAVRRSVRRILEREGYTVLEARHGADALLVWHEHDAAIDLLITDLRMPELGGRELMAALHAIKPDLPVIAMSGYPPDVGTAPLEIWNTSGHTRFLAKPFSTEVLLSAVEHLLHPA
ncbi:MAG: sensor protein [Gemmatimonadetes bacterium]|nr:sensor protein [Gemmatimonadota bacterium]